jgi:hypothetical protein
VFDPISSFFTPIDAFLTEDAIITLVFLSGNGVKFEESSNDPCYRVSPTTTPIAALGPNSTYDSIPLYLPSEPASPLGCIEQAQFYREDTNHCGPLASFIDAELGAAPVFDLSIDEEGYLKGDTTLAATFEYVMKAFTTNSYLELFNTLHQLGPASLASQSTLIAAVQAPLPSNQWQLDVIPWSEVARAKIQAAFLSTAYFLPTGPNAIRVNFTLPHTAKLCYNQVRDGQQTTKLR